MRTIVAALLLGTALPGLALAQGAGQGARPAMMGQGVGQAMGSGPALSEGHARSAMTDFGCNGITALGVAPDGSYHGQCTKGGRLINVMMDRSGRVSEATNITHVTEGQARYALTSFGCNSISALGVSPNGNWHGQCVKGGQVTNVMVDSKGVASAASGTTISEGQARYALTDFGCNSVTTLSMGGDGSWHGQCVKGGRTQNVAVDRTGKASGS